MEESDISLAGLCMLAMQFGLISYPIAIELESGSSIVSEEFSTH